jgi:glycerophosphoryl diester phosphodiesterase
MLVAHRGASGHAPENTLAAFRLALEMGADGIELDVHMSRDGEIVVMHDATLNRTTGRRGRVGRKTLWELKALDAGHWFNRSFPEKARAEYEGERIPTLDEVMAMIGRRTRLYIEIKNPRLYPETLGTELLRLVRYHRLRGNVIFLSFDRRFLRKIRTLDDSIPTLLLVSRTLKDPVKSAATLGVGSLGLMYRLAGRPLIAKARKAGLGVIVWTVNGVEDLRRMINSDVDAIVTNYPDRFRTILHEFRN